MKKIAFVIMAFALATATLFSSCKKDDDKDGTWYGINATFSGKVSESFSTTAAGFKQSASEAGTSTSALKSILGSADGNTIIFGTKDNNQLLITLKGTTSGTYTLNTTISGVSNTTVTNAIISLLSGESITETVKDVATDAVDDIATDALIIYKANNAAEGSTGYWFSTAATVTMTTLSFYSTGSFSATMMNSSKDTFTISNGTFSVAGLPAKTTSSK